MLSTNERVFDARFTGASEQLVGNGLPLCPGRRHSVREASDLCSKLRVALGDEDIAGGSPAAFDFFAGRQEC